VYACRRISGQVCGRKSNQLVEFVPDSGIPAGPNLTGFLGWKEVGNSAWMRTPSALKMQRRVATVRVLSMVTKPSPILSQQL
jgi:hypothetical protein